MRSITVKLAKMIATEAHEGQRDKNDKPYIGHPGRVAKYAEALAEEKGINPVNAIAVAWLHDVLEDTQVTKKQLSHEFPREIVKAVEDLTHQQQETLEDYCARIKRNELALLVKKADIQDNTNPERMAGLDEETRLRLTDKYQRMSRLLAV
ncbi:HD domain-containing protein [Rothia aerolata]|uniref:Phosphohydrolase n=1 Tax=Rothia aerolata TaxID=1812262 RepID=A0A917ILG0_9MICC|nr:HD domain-containing protein [Rothia aerolata]GGH57960.1 phosphohydrolase [Rothia aerolata]